MTKAEKAPKPTQAEILADGPTLVHAILLRNMDILRNYQPENKSEEEKKLLVEYAQHVMNFLHGHHQTEEEYWFPEISKQCKVDLKRFTDEHKEVQPIWDKVDQKLEAMSKEIKENDFAELQTFITEMKEVCEPHFKAEEEVITPALVAEHMSDKECKKVHKAVVKLSVSHMKEQKVVLPMMIYSLDNEQQKRFSAQLPWFVRSVLVKLIWKKKYARFIPLFFNHPKNHPKVKKEKKNKSGKQDPEVEAVETEVPKPLSPSSIVSEQPEQKEQEKEQEQSQEQTSQEQTQEQTQEENEDQKVEKEEAPISEEKEETKQEEETSTSQVEIALVENQQTEPQTTTEKEPESVTQPSETVTEQPTESANQPTTTQETVVESVQEVNSSSVSVYESSSYDASPSVTVESSVQESTTSHD